MTLPVISGAASISCPCDENLLGLLTEELLTTDAELSLVGHLNECEHCQHRLEDFAGEADAWQNVQRHLTALQNAESPPVARFVAGLTASLSAPVGDTTRILAESDENSKAAP